MTCGHPDVLENLSWLRDDRRALGGSWRCRECSRERAQARRDGHWSDPETGTILKPCASSESYWRYEHSDLRSWQRLWYPKLGPGAHRLSRKARGRAIRVWGDQMARATAQRFGLNEELFVRAVRGKVNMSSVIVAAEQVAQQHSI